MKPEILLDPNTPSSHKCVQSTDLTSHPGELELGKRIGRGVARSSQVGRGSCTLRFSESISGSVASGSKTWSKDGHMIGPLPFGYPDHTMLHRLADPVEKGLAGASHRHWRAAEAKERRESFPKLKLSHKPLGPLRHYWEPEALGDA